MTGNGSFWWDRSYFLLPTGKTDPFWTAERTGPRVDIEGMAAFKTHDRNGVTLRRGEFLASLTYLQERWGWHRSKIRRFLRALCERNELIMRRRTTHGCVYYVVGYEDRQLGRYNSDTPNRHSNRHTQRSHSDSEQLALMRSAERRPTQQPTPPTDTKRSNYLDDGDAAYAASPSSGSYPHVKKKNVEIVFAYWTQERARILDVNGGPPMRLTDKRASKIRARLDDGYSVEQLKRAIDGCLGSEFHVKNHHTDIELICRDQSHVERFRARQAELPHGHGDRGGDIRTFW